jgi:hypothetical protein
MSTPAGSTLPRARKNKCNRERQRQASRSVVLEDVRKAEARRKLHLYLANRKHVLLVMQYLYFHVSEKYTTTVVIYT